MIALMATNEEDEQIAELKIDQHDLVKFGTLLEKRLYMTYPTQHERKLGKDLVAFLKEAASNG